MFQRQLDTLSFASLSDSQRQQCLVQINKDLADRSIPGAIYYLVTWFGIVFLLMHSSQDVDLNEWIYGVSIMIAVTSIIRMGLIYWAKKVVEQTSKSRYLLVLGMILSSLSWGLMASLSFLDTPLSAQQHLIFISTVGLCGGGVLSFCASRMFTALFLASMMLPTLLVELFVLDQMDPEVVVVIVIYSAGLLSTARHPYREYMSALLGNLKLEQISNTDALSGIGNRRFFDTKFDEEIRRAKRNTSSLSLLMIDIDHFKKVNDNYGHPAGDQCIKTLAERLEQLLQRAGDTVYRLGGEEFAVILPSLSQEHCAEFSEMLREEIASKPILFEGQGISITVSVGCYTLPQVPLDEDAEQIVSKVDDALYNAKRLGRNRVEFAS